MQNTDKHILKLKIQIKVSHTYWYDQSKIKWKNKEKYDILGGQKFIVFLDQILNFPTNSYITVKQKQKRSHLIIDLHNFNDKD